MYDASLFFLQVRMHVCLHMSVCVCPRVCVSVSPKSIFACANRCFVSLPRGRGQAPPSSSRLFPLFSPFTSICSSGGHVGDTCVPVAAQRNQVTLQTGRHYSWSCKGAHCPLSALNTHLGREGGRKKGESYHARRPSAINTLARWLLCVSVLALC